MEKGLKFGLKIGAHSITLQFQNYANFMGFSKMVIIINICPNPWYGILSYLIFG
jgi:hypothetical protein